MSPASCTVPENRVLAYVAGDLAENEELALAEHLGQGEACCAQAAEFAALPACCAEGVVRWHSFRTPFGSMYVAATDHGLTRVSWGRRAERFVREMEERFPGRVVIRDPYALTDAERQLQEYFAGTRSRFELPVDLGGLSPFDRRVLETARTIPYGEVISYRELARRIARPQAARAVGNALGRNPVAIVVPCHRVVRSDGSLGGYGGGIAYKKKLLAIEGRTDLLRAG